MNGYGYGKTNSSKLVHDILMFFSLGYGYNIPYDATMSSSCHEETAKSNENFELFRTKLVNQLEKLIGHKPRLVLENGLFTIYYEWIDWFT